RVRGAGRVRSGAPRPAVRPLSLPDALPIAARVAVEAGLGGDDAAELGAFGGGQRVRAGDQLLELGDQSGADGGVAFGGVGVVAGHEPVGFADPYLFDLQVVGHVLVAALPGQGGLGFG